MHYISLEKQYKYIIEKITINTVMSLNILENVSYSRQQNYSSTCRKDALL